jgi:hypothetical protein
VISLSGFVIDYLLINFDCRIKITIDLLGVQSFLQQNTCRLGAGALAGQAVLQPNEGEYAYGRKRNDCEDFESVHSILLSSKIT